MSRLFGTDGIRGIVGETMTCELAMRVGRATAAVLTGNACRKQTVVVGMDTRASSGMLSCALAAGLCSAGADVRMLGVIPTPAVAYLTGKYRADAGIVISASHNEASYNGIKIFSGSGYKLPDEIEEQIEQLTCAETHSEEMIKTECGRIYICRTTADDYIGHLCSTVSESLAGMRLAVDCANGSASVTAGRLFEKLGVECHLLSERPDGWNINENCGSTHLDALREYVVSRGIEMGVAFDGDADRCLFVDGRGNVIDGDFIMAICALDMMKRGVLKKQTVVGTVMSNLGFVRFCEKNGIHMASTKVGDRYVLEEMRLQGCNLGGEQSGHIIFHDYATTGDGQLTALQVLSVLRGNGITLEQAASVMKRYPQRTENVQVRPEGKVQFYLDEEIKRVIEAEERRLGTDGRVVVRPSGTEPLIRVMAEGENEETIESAVANISSVIKRRLI